MAIERTSWGSYKIYPTGYDNGRRNRPEPNIQVRKNIFEDRIQFETLDMDGDVTVISLTYEEVEELFLSIMAVKEGK